MFGPAIDSGSQWSTWDQCNTYCPNSYPGATMLCVNNVAENEWIRSQSGGNYMWIGYTDMLPYGGGKGTKQYAWVTGCSSTYTNWQVEIGQPDNAFDDEDYAVVDYDNGAWYDLASQDPSFCGCEYTPALTTTPSSHPSTVPSFRPKVAPIATPSYSSSQGDVSE